MVAEPTRKSFSGAGEQGHLCLPVEFKDLGTNQTMRFLLLGFWG